MSGLMRCTPIWRTSWSTRMGNQQSGKHCCITAVRVPMWKASLQKDWRGAIVRRAVLHCYWLNYLRRSCKTLIKDHERQIEVKIIDANNVGAFYKHVNRRIKCRSGVSPLRGPANELVNDDFCKAELLNKFFLLLLVLLIIVKFPL